MTSLADALTSTGSIPPVPASALGAPDKSLDSRLDAALDRLGKQEDQLTKASEEASVGIKERQKQRESTEIPKVPELTPPPQSQPRDPMQAFGSAAGWLATFGSILTRQPLATSLNAAAGVMNAWKQQDYAAAKQQFDTWKVSTDNALKLHEFARDYYKDDMEKLKAGDDAALNDLRAKAVALKDSTVVALADLKDRDGLLRHMDAVDKQNSALQKNQLAMMESADKIQKVLALHSDPKYQAASLQEKAQMEQDVLHPKTGASASAETTLTPQAVDMAAQTYLVTHQLPYLGMGGAGGGRQAVLNRAAQLAQEQGLTVEDIVAGQASYKADAHSLMMLSKMNDAAVAFENTAKNNMEIAKSLMNKGSGTQEGPVVNRWLQAGRKETGDPDVKAFNAAITTSANEYAKVMSGATGAQGSTDAARAQANDLVSSIDSPAAVDKVFETMAREMAGRNQSYAQQREVIQTRLRTEGQRNQPMSPSENVPKGVDPKDWEYMTPEQKALFHE